MIASSFGWGSALFGLAGGALIGLAAPPSERRFKRPRARLVPLVGAGLVLQVLAGRLDGGAAVLAALAGFACR